MPRDGVRLLVARPGRPLRHLVFAGLPGVLRRGDLVVVNDSDTEPAALDGHRADGRPVVLHVSGPAPGGGGEWIVELRTPDGRRVGDGARGRGGAAARRRDGVPAGRAPRPAPPHGQQAVAGADPASRAGCRAGWRAVGRPIRYPYLRGPRPIDDYRTVFARRDGHGFASAEMPSAARPFTPAVLGGLHRRGVEVAGADAAHRGRPRLEAGEEPLPERYAVPATTAAAVNATRATGGRVIAVGTTVTRALETVADPDGAVHAGAGWTDLVLGPGPARPGRRRAGHRLARARGVAPAAAGGGGRAAAGAAGLRRGAVDRGYLWHEFGDSCLLLP